MAADTLTVTIGDQRMAGDHRTFSSGSRGYYIGGKVVLDDGKRYQVTCSVVEIGSKPDSGNTAKRGRKAA